MAHFQACPTNAPAGKTVRLATLLAAKSKEEFADCLRELRAQAGAPSFRKLARVAHYASSTLADGCRPSR
jgi:hypothetical protein